jgi:hypothetical protein
MGRVAAAIKKPIDKIYLFSVPLLTSLDAIVHRLFQMSRSSKYPQCHHKAFDDTSFDHWRLLTEEDWTLLEKQSRNSCTPRSRSLDYSNCSSTVSLE